MKFRVLLSSCLFFISILYSGVTYADTGATGLASINVTAPTQNALTLEQEPSFDFGIVKYNWVLEFTTTSTTKYQILDLRGQANSLYDIQAEITDFTTDSGKSVLPVSHFVVSVGDSQDGQLKGAKNVDIFHQSGKVASGVTGTLKNEESGDVTAKLILKSHSGIKPNEKYTATITHRIVAGVR